MDDFKIVFYIIVAIAWVVYSNYKKITEEAKKRNPGKRPPEVIQENWPSQPHQPMKPVAVPSTKSPVPARIPSREILKPARVRPERNVKKRTAPVETVSQFYQEGGNIKPSDQVQFSYAKSKDDIQDLVLEEIRTTDWKRAVILSEILKRPYT